MKARILAAGTLCLLFAVADTAVAEEKGRWLAATNAPHCKIWDAAGSPEQTFEWKGACDAAGLVTGHGLITWKWNGMFTSMTEISPGNGLALENGRMIVRLPATGINMKQIDCGTVKVEVPRSVAIAYDWVAHAILTKAAEASKAKCPNSGVTACIYYKDHDPEVPGTAWLKSCEVHWYWHRTHPKMSFDGYWNKPKRDVEALMDRIRREQIAEAKAQKYAAEAAQLSAAKKAAEKNATEGRSAFTKKYGVTKFVTASELKANPFRFEGQTVAVVQSFDSMLGPNRALMSDLVADGVPSSLFKGGERILLALKVMGNTSVKTPLGGEVLAPHGKYVGSVTCRTNGCTDYGVGN
jgi:hypothetical protein